MAKLRRHHVFLTIVVALIQARTTSAAPDRLAYQIQFPGSPPTSGADALSTFGSRADTVLKFLACGEEAEFVDGATLRNRPDDSPRFANAEDVGEGMLHRVMAKMIVYSNWSRFVSAAASGRDGCRQHVEYFALKPKHNPGDPDIPDTSNLDFTNVSKQIVDLFGGRCITPVESSSIGSNGLVKIDYFLTRECIRRQINIYLKNAYVNGQVGSTGLPCFPIPIKTTDGEWDVNLKELTRIYLLNQRAAQDPLSTMTSASTSATTCLRWTELQARSLTTWENAETRNTLLALPMTGRTIRIGRITRSTISATRWAGWRNGSFDCLRLPSPSL
jgi:hypothetical protein